MIMDITMRQLSICITLFLLILTTPMRGQEQVTLPEQSVSLTDTLVADSAAMAIDTLPQVVLTYPQILLDMPNVHMEQDSLITLLIEEKIAGVERGEKEMPGFRVQIYSSNHPQRGKSEALQLEQRMKEIVSVPVYVIYDSPSWKVRLGDFLTEQQATDFRDALKLLCPDLIDYTYIVRDKVKIR